MHQSPRMRRLRNDLAALERLQAESSVFRFTSQGDPPQHYRILFQGRGLWRDHGKVKTLEKHHVEVKLGASYPRTIPEIRWLTPVYHPNISEIGMVCLGGYGTHWVPSVQLDELCTMLWDMLRYHNYDIRSPYNREAALWVAQQQAIRFPTDARPLRDLRAALGRVDATSAKPAAAEAPARDREPAGPRGSSARGSSGRVGKVRDFAQRYARVFGVRAEVVETRQADRAAGGAEAPSPSVPVSSDLGELVAAQSAPVQPASDPDGEPVFILDPDPAPADSGSRSETVDVSAEVRRLLHADRRGSSPPGDEIVFID
ncbi:MAG: ubiquitin-conjugating enzyme E2 [Isosphaeraceae bacterium]